MEDSGSIGLEEERRLMYVALTRAKDRLYLTDSKGFSYYGEKRISRFIDEIKQNHLNIHIDTIVPQKEEHPSTDIKFKSAIIAKKVSFTIIISLDLLNMEILFVIINMAYAFLINTSKIKNAQSYIITKQ